MSGSHDQTIKIWNPNETTEWKTLKGNFGSVTSIAIFSNGKIVSGSIKITSKYSELKIFDSFGETEYAWISLEGHTNKINALVVLPNGYLASRSSDNSIKIWNPLDGT